MGSSIIPHIPQTTNLFPLLMGLKKDTTPGIPCLKKTHTGCLSHDWRTTLWLHQLAGLFQKDLSSNKTSWWFQPIWNILSNWIISPSRDENKTYVEPPPRKRSPNQPTKKKKRDFPTTSTFQRPENPRVTSVFCRLPSPRQRVLEPQKLVRWSRLVPLAYIYPLVAPKTYTLF